jgi:electron transfer flavoprotein alpha/beta subunit
VRVESISTRIAVFVRPVQNPAISVEPSSTRVLEELPGYHPIPNPMDELALEVGLRLRERALPSVTVLACSVGGRSSRRVLQEFLACGADRAVCIEETDWEPDGAVVAACLSEYYRSEPFDLGLFGARDLDTGAGEVGPMFSALTGLPYIDSVVEVKWGGEREVRVTRKQKRLREEICITLPACLGIQRGSPLRYPSFWAKLEAEGSRIRTVPPGDVRRGPRLERQKFTRSKPRRGSVADAYAAKSSVDRMRQALGIGGGGGERKEDSFLKGNPEDAVKRVLTILKEERIMDVQCLSEAKGTEATE